MILKVIFAKSVDPDQTAPLGANLGPHCLPVYKNRFEKLARIFSRRHKQTTLSWRFKGKQFNKSILLPVDAKNVEWMTNTDSDQTPHSASSDLGLHCLPMTACPNT